MWTLFLMASILTATSAKKKHTSNDDGEDGQKRMVDRLAMNMADAFVASLFPDVTEAKNKIKHAKKAHRLQEQAVDMRRSPAMSMEMQQMQPSGTSMAMQQIQSFSPEMAAAAYNGLVQDPSANPMSPLQRSRSAMTQPRALGTATSMGWQSGSSGSEAFRDTPIIESILPASTALLSGARAAPTAELSTYSQKQMEYLDQQRRYQQAMIDHQAGAALLMQQQQQALLEKQMRAAEEAGAASSLFRSAPTPPDNTGARNLLTDASAEESAQRLAPPKFKYTEDDLVATDDSLKRYFRDHYNIEIPEDGRSLTDDERDTLRLLKKELQAKKRLAVEQGAFYTMEQLKPKVLMRKKEKDVFRSSSRATFSQEEYSERDQSDGHQTEDGCPPCIPVKLREIAGSWTQIYGNADALKKTFSTIMSLESIDLNEESLTVARSRRKPVCVGMEMSDVIFRNSSSLNMFFRDDQPNRKLHEMQGEIVKEDDGTMLLSTDLYNMKGCVLRAGPSEADQYEYFAIGEANDASQSPCSVIHVFARNIDEFHLRHFDDISDFMRNLMKKGVAEPVSQLPEPKLCQITPEETE